MFFHTLKYYLVAFMCTLQLYLFFLYPLLFHLSQHFMRVNYATIRNHTSEKQKKRKK